MRKISGFKNIYEQQTHNKRVTAAFYVAMGCLFLLLGVGFDIATAGEAEAAPLIPLPALPLVGFMVSSSALRLMRRSGVLRSADDDSGPSELGMSVSLLLVYLAIAIFLFQTLNAQHSGAGSTSAVVESDTAASFGFPYGTIAAAVIALAVAFWTHYQGAEALFGYTLAGEIPKEGESGHILRNVVEEMSIAAGIPPPAVYIVRDPDPNAYALGMKPSESSIVVTEGLLKVLNREELEGVVAHEISHIRNRDTQLMTSLTILFGAIILVADWSRKGMIFGSAFKAARMSIRRGILGLLLFFLWLATVLFAGIVARLITLAVSRTREFLADASAAELTRNPLALANALGKIDQCAAPTVSVNRALQPSCIVDPRGLWANRHEGFIADLFATHPPIHRRIMLLKEMAYQV
jgi:heat shock protein HtpX